MLIGAAPPPPLPPVGYVEMADMALSAQQVLAVAITRATPLKAESAVGVAPGKVRFFIEAHVDALIGGKGPAPADIRYLVDLPASMAKAKLKGMAVLLLGNPTGTPGEFSLIGPHAQIARTPENETRIRAILTASLASDAPPQITGIGHAFHVAGTLPGEGETQIFVRTADGRPISLSILRRPGEKPHWAVALSELVDASAAPPQPESFLWYRLACGLPPKLPDSALEGVGDEDAAQARQDYQVVIDGLGPCKRAG
ncbi:hypothetical protein FHS31_001705 [Sphingomonas vulcanisoli]|uniref:DUF4384 domain-containing protein n=1 Tax=Sphingomonas vulcanisoli TaxID=1658060 RepID=A0ABX0TWC9_9SPHN|nr:hypothetical protein [Sphingomonas vulcanisoli]NIJ08095.1 hypothetical protein [Sphingomonas vulcanisoli]